MGILFIFLKLTIEFKNIIVLHPIQLLCVKGVYSLIHTILMFFIWSGNHKFDIQFLRQLGLQSFRITLYNHYSFICIKHRLY
jgi:hypothetical protein